MNDLSTFLFLGQTALLVVASLLIVYPVVTHSRNVAHTKGLVLLSAAFLMITATYVATFVFEMPLLSELLDLAGAILGAAGVWQFARPFVRFGDEELKTPTARESSGGFESAGDD